MKNYYTIDLTGKIIGKLTVLYRATDDKRKWTCKCDCGDITDVFHSNLRRNHTISCGCYRKQRILEGITKHGMTKTSEFNIWQGMKQRCYDENCKAYKDYGGRGIKVCKRWLGEKGFENFFMDMGNRPSKKHTLDRHPNNNGDYKPSNCRWATKRQQAQNRRYNLKIQFNGEEMTLSEFGHRFNIKGTAMYNHIKKKTPKEILEFYKIKPC